MCDKVCRYSESVRKIEKSICDCVKKMVAMNDISLCYTEYLKILQTRLDCFLKFKKNLKVGICCWDLSRNPAGRAFTLAELYSKFASVCIFGVLDTNDATGVWEPIVGSKIPVDPIEINDWNRFAYSAIEYVISHRYDVVHLSKPRSVNLLFGILYKLIWNSKILFDVDDNELSFVKVEKPFGYEHLLATNFYLPNSFYLRGAIWTQVANLFIKEFDGLTVSNIALQEKYGGTCIPHLRSDELFKVSLHDTLKIRNDLKLNENDKVVIFLGTPRRHKGIVDISNILKKLGRDDVVFLIVGKFEDIKLKQEITKNGYVRTKFIEYVPFCQMPKYLSVASACIFPQDINSSVSNFQVPAKITDSMALGVVTFATRTKPLAELFENSVLLDVDSNITKQLAILFDTPSSFDGHRKKMVEYFNKNLTCKSYVSVVKSVLNKPQIQSFPNEKLNNLLIKLKVTDLNPIYNLSKSING